MYGKAGQLACTASDILFEMVVGCSLGDVPHLCCGCIKRMTRAGADGTGSSAEFDEERFVL